MARPKKKAEKPIVFKALFSPKQYFRFGEDGEQFQAKEGFFITDDLDIIAYLDKNSSWENIGELKEDEQNSENQITL